VTIEIEPVVVVEEVIGVVAIGVVVETVEVEAVGVVAAPPVGTCNPQWCATFPRGINSNSVLSTLIRNMWCGCVAMQKVYAMPHRQKW